jgi:RNA polymerase sigma factor (TIGR02999 family)
MPLVYDELRRVARRQLRREYGERTLQSTALVHEAYIRLINLTHADWKDRAHFFGIAARLMREILVDHARRRQAGKRGGGALKVSLGEWIGAIGDRDVRDADLLPLDVALDRLADMDPRQSRIVELRYFPGLSVEETAEVLGMSTATTKRHWTAARAWLYNEITGRGLQ